jgi:hypothetical protein
MAAGPALRSNLFAEKAKRISTSIGAAYDTKQFLMKKNGNDYYKAKIF